MPKDLHFKARYGDWALVSGAAQGIGASYCDRLGAMGLSLIALDNDEAALTQSTNQLAEKYPQIQIKPLVVDLADAEALNRALDGLAEIEIGVLVANAGIGGVGRWLEVPLELKMRMIAINCISTLILAHRLTPGMVARKRGGVIIMSSGSADMGSSFITTYAATKAFDRVFAEGLWAELKNHGIDVTTVMPGAVNTPGFRNSLPPGQEPTRLMQPVDPSLIVDAALNGLGRQINVKPSTAGGFTSALLKLAMALMPRKTLLQLGNKAVCKMYDR